MSKKILFIYGSPLKKGSTWSIAQISLKEVKNRGGDIYEIDATKLKFQIPGCTACMQCHQSDDFGCVVDDQLTETVAALIDYEVIVLVTPTYWMSYPAQIKMLIDRMGSLIKFTEAGEVRTPLFGKVFSLITTGNGGLENNLELVEQQWRNVAHMFSCDFYSCLFPNAPIVPGALNNDPSTINKAQQFGQLLASL